MPEKNRCPRCLGCGQLANSDDREPWSAWSDLPPGSDLAVRMGIVQPIPCDECGGTGQASPGDDSTWCIHVQGPDDLLPAASRIDAARRAHEMNHATVSHPEVLDEQGIYPTVWAVPARRSDVQGGPR